MDAGSTSPSHSESEVLNVTAGSTAEEGTAYWSTRSDSRWGLQAKTNTIGIGSGTIQSVPAGINCGTDCYEIYNSGETVMLSAAPTLGSTFIGWSGDCTTSTGPCTVIMDAEKSIAATFSNDPSEIPNGIYRFYNTTTEAHFFTASIEEKNYIITFITFVHL